MYIGYDEDRKEFYLMNRENDYMDWIKVDEETISEEDKKKIKEQDGVLYCEIAITVH